MQSLFEAILDDLRECANDENGPHRPEWQPSEKYPTGVVITTIWSRDPSMSSNGGEYYSYSRYRTLEDGRVINEIRSSYEDAEWELMNTYDISGDSLHKMAELARQRVLAETAPPPVDLVKVRRRIEDALRKTASDNDLIAIGGLLGIKLD